MKAHNEAALLQGAAEALRAHGLIVSLPRDGEFIPGSQRQTEWLRVSRDRSRFEYSPQVKHKLSAQGVRAVVMQLQHPMDVGVPAPLLITTQVTRPVAEQLRALDQQFVDAAGNAYLEGRGLFIYVTGRKLCDKEIALRARKDFSATRLKVLFALICDPELSDAPYGEIAAAADVAVTAMPTVVAEMCEQACLTIVDKQKRLNRSKQLLDAWAHDYALGLRGKTLTARYRSEQFDEWRSWPVSNGRLFWGGEPAAALLCGDLIPNVLTLYGGKLPTRLITHGSLTLADPVAYEKLVEIRKPFWGDSLRIVGRSDTVPAALVYADLLATGNARCFEAAQRVYDFRLARLFPAG